MYQIKIVSENNGAEKIYTYNNIAEYKTALEYYGVCEINANEENTVTIIC